MPVVRRQFREEGKVQLCRLTGGAPGGGAGGDGVAGEVGFTFRAGAAFFPTVLEKPIFGWDVGDVAAGGEAVD